MEATTNPETPEATAGRRPGGRVDAPPFFESPSAQRMLSILAHSKAMGTMGLITGAPGVGKSTAARHLAGMYPAVWIMTAHPAVSTHYQALRGLAAALDVVRSASQAALDLVESICREVQRHKRPLIVVDEAQHLKLGALEALRTVHDSTGVGLVLTGNLDLYRHVMSHPQLSSRIMGNCRITAPTDQDVNALTVAWSVGDTRVAGLLQRIAKSPGGLRIATHVMRVAAASKEGASLEGVRLAVKFLGLEGADK